MDVFSACKAEVHILVPTIEQAARELALLLWVC